MSEDASAEPTLGDGSLDTRQVIRERARRMAWLYTGAAVVLLPWIAYLAITLPRRDLDRHYRLAWVGFDCLLVFAIVRTAYMAFRIDPRVQFPATATATLLFVDAWFDITTSGSREAALEALLLALLVEIPAAIFSIHMARRVNRQVLELAHLDPYALRSSRKARRARAHRSGRAGPGDPDSLE
jgi:hypothetical protein